MEAKRGDGFVVGAGIVLALLGVVLLLMEMGVIELDWRYVGPVLLILAGLWIALRGFGSSRLKKADDAAPDFASYRPRKPAP